MKVVACFILAGLVSLAAKSSLEIFNRAVQSLGSGDYAAAEQGFEEVLREEPRQVAALSNLGIVYSRTNRPDRAIGVYRRALQVSPNDKAILLNLGLVYLKQEAHAKALPIFARVVALDPGHAQARQLLAVCRVYTGQLVPAIRDLELLRLANPRDEGILFLLGFAYLKNREADKANAMFALMLDAAGPVRADFLLGKAYYEATLFPQAEESFLRVLKLESTFPGVHLELGKVYISLRRTEDAKRELESELKTNPVSGDASYFLGGLLVQEGSFAEGIPYLERARLARPDLWATYFYLGKAKQHLGNSTEAVTLLKRAIELNPDDANSYYQLGQALKATGRESEAKATLLKVRNLKAAALEAVKLDGRVAGAR